MVKPAYTIAMAAVLVVAAFAGIALMGDDADGASEGEFNVTYSINGSTIVKETTDGKFTFEAATEVLSGYTEPTGYTFAGWKDVNSTTVYQVDTEYTFISDVTVEPYLSVSGAIVNFVYGDATYTIAKEETSYDVTVEDIKAFAAEAKLTYTEGSDLLDMLTLKEAEFMGFAVEGSEDYITDLADLGLDAAGEVTYTAVFETVYSVSFYFDETTKLTSVDSNRISESDLSALPDAPTMANHTFQGWVDAEGKTVFTYDALNETYVMAKDYVFDKETSLYADFKANMMYVTFMVNGVQYGAISEVSFGNTVNEPVLPAGYAYWAIQTKAPVYGEDGTTIVEEAKYAEFDFETVISENLVLYAIPTDEVPDESIYATFNIEGTIYGPYKVTDRFSIPQTDREGYNFIGWTIQGGDGTLLTSAQVQNYKYTEDVTFVANYEVAEPPAPEEPAFYETTTGQMAIVIVVFVLLFFGYAVYSNMGGIKDKLFGYTISKKEKKE